MICPRCSAKTKVIISLASEHPQLSREPNVFVRCRCEQRHSIPLQVFGGMINQEHCLTSQAQNPDIIASFN